MTIGISREYSSPRAPGAAFAIILTLAVNGVLFGAIAWINGRAVKAADARIRNFTPVAVVKPPPVVQPKPQLARPEDPEPETKPLTTKRQPLRVSRAQRMPMPKPLSLKLDLPSFQPTLNPGLILPVGDSSEGLSISKTELSKNSDPLGYDDVDTKPTRTKYVPPVFPTLSRRLGQSGEVTVEFIVDKNGLVTGEKVIKSTGKGRFDRSALRAVGEWKFSPAKHRGSAVPVRCVVTIEFKLDTR